jgi:hypothetical protein
MSWRVPFLPVFQCGLKEIYSFALCRARYDIQTQTLQTHAISKIFNLILYSLRNFFPPYTRPHTHTHT